MALLVGLAFPLGLYITKVMNGERIPGVSKVLTPCENLIYKVMRVKADEQMGWKKYLLSVVLFNLFGFLLLFLLCLCQGFLPFNPQHIEGNSWHLAFNTASSFMTNTNWQAYSGENALSYFTQFMGLTVQNFVSAATGIAVLFAFIRGLIKVKSQGLGSFWVDLTKIILYILLPICLVMTVLLVSQGVAQSFAPAETVDLLEPIAVDSEGNILEDAVIDGDKVLVEGAVVEGAVIVRKQIVPLGPAASQISMKQLGTNGGGFYGVNSSHPLENTTPFSNMLEMLALLVIPVALCFTFGRGVKDKRQGRAIFLAMFLMLAAFLAVIAVNEQAATPQLAQNGAVDLSNIQQAGGNMEGKESRFGIASSATWASWTTAASNAVSYTHLTLPTTERV